MSLRTRLRKSILKRLGNLCYPSGFHLSRREGALWLLNHRNFVDRQLGLFGGFEQLQLAQFFAPAPKPADVFLDVGANFGLYSVLAAIKGAAKRIIAFEPDPRNAAQLHANLYLNGLAGRVEVRAEAVSDKDGPIGLLLDRGGSTGQTRVVGEEQATATVPAIALDNHFDWRGLDLLVKIDVEGHEYGVLLGMARLLTENQARLQIEIFEENRTKVEPLLADLGYECFDQIGQVFYYQSRIADQVA